jgi:hypothetical protein
VKWETRSLDPIRAAVIPHFSKYPMLSGKQRDFERFADICDRMARREHLLRSGLVEIVRLAGEMNPSGKRGYPADLIIRSLTKMKA